MLLFRALQHNRDGHIAELEASLDRGEDDYLDAIADADAQIVSWEAQKAAERARGAAFLGLWIVLMPSTKPADLAMGLVSAAVATWASLRLLPPASGHVRFGVLLAFAPHFLWESARADRKSVV